MVSLAPSILPPTTQPITYPALETTTQQPFSASTGTAPLLPPPSSSVPPFDDTSSPPPPPPTGPLVEDTKAPPPPPATNPPRPSSIAKDSTLLLEGGPEEEKVSISVLTMGGMRKTWRFEGSMTIGRVKEMIWHSWPAEWTIEPSLPPSPSYFRILYRGRMLDDESTLASENILPSNSPQSRPTIVHLSIRTIPLPTSDEDDKNASSSPRPPLHTRASSRLRSFVQPSSNPNNPSSTSGAVPAGAAQASRINERRAAAAEANAGGRDSHGGGCGCVIM